MVSQKHHYPSQILWLLWKLNRESSFCPTNFQELAGPFARVFAGHSLLFGSICGTFCRTICWSSVGRVLRKDFKQSVFILASDFLHLRKFSFVLWHDSLIGKLYHISFLTFTCPWFSAIDMKTKIYEWGKSLSDGWVNNKTVLIGNLDIKPNTFLWKNFH